MLQNNTTGFDNTVSGIDALFHNMTGNKNTASGFRQNNTHGHPNISEGYKASSPAAVILG